MRIRPYIITIYHATASIENTKGTLPAFFPPVVLIFSLLEMEPSLLPEDVESMEIFFDATEEFAEEEEESEVHHCPEQSKTVHSLTRRNRRRSSRTSPEVSTLVFLGDYETKITPSRSLEESVSSGVTFNHPISLGTDVHSHSSSSFLFFVAGLFVKAVAFQIRLMVMGIAFPFSIVYLSFLFVTDPFGTVRKGRDHVVDRIGRWAGALKDKFGPVFFEWVGKQKTAGKMAVRIAWGCFWSVYVVFALIGCLLSAFLIARLVMHFVVEEIVEVNGELRFDYTKDSPVAVVPVASCDEFGSVVDFEDLGKVRKIGRCHSISKDRKLQLTVFLTLPESDYNRRLGIFQVRTEFFTADGKVIGHSSRPCMLKFKSSPIRYLETAFRSGLLLTGYSSESQIVKLKIEGFMEHGDPIEYLRVHIERRAEYRPGSGIPEIYAASLELKWELPLFRRIIWTWRKTLFIWFSMSLFIFELLIVLVCCRSLVIPRAI